MLRWRETPGYIMACSLGLWSEDGDRDGPVGLVQQQVVPFFSPGPPSRGSQCLPCWALVQVDRMTRI